MSGRLYSECSKNIFVCTISLKLLLVGQLLCDFFHVGTDLVIDVHIHGYITFSEVNMGITGNNGETVMMLESEWLSQTYLYPIWFPPLGNILPPKHQPTDLLQHFDSSEQL